MWNYCNIKAYLNTLMLDVINRDLISENNVRLISYFLISWQHY